MAFNMLGGLLTFTNTLAAMKRGDYAAAADGMLASKWATQVGARDAARSHDAERSLTIS